MARMFAEGLELPPLLLDDPFAYWDDTRIERCIPIIAHNAFDAQTILFTASPELAAVAERIGATRIDLVSAVSLRPPYAARWICASRGTSATALSRSTSALSCGVGL